MKNKCCKCIVLFYLVCPGFAVAVLALNVIWSLYISITSFPKPSRLISFVKKPMYLCYGVKKRQI